MSYASATSQGRLSMTGMRSIPRNTAKCCSRWDGTPTPILKWASAHKRLSTSRYLEMPTSCLLSFGHALAAARARVQVEQSKKFKSTRRQESQLSYIFPMRRARLHRLIHRSSKPYETFADGAKRTGCIELFEDRKPFAQ